MPSTVTDEQVRRFAALFDGRQSAYGQMTLLPDGQKRVNTYNKPLPPDGFTKHLMGEGPFLGIIPIREDNTVCFGAIDVDDDGVDHFELEQAVRQHQLPLVVCRSKSGGAHLYLFCQPTPAHIVIEVLQTWKTTLNYRRNHSNNSPVEVFPKQKKLAPGQTGNWINLPYYEHESTNRYAVADGRALSLDEFLPYAEARRISETNLTKLVNPDLGPFADGPPCLQKLHAQGFQAGGRNTGLLNVGIFYKLSRKDDWAEALDNYNQECVTEPVEERELVQIKRNLERHEYAYTCEAHPLQPLCDKKTCKKQVFGIGHWIKQRRMADIPEITSLVKVLTDPPRYRVKVNGQEIQLAAEQLEHPHLFRSVCLVQLNMAFAVPSPKDWVEVLQNLLASQIEESAPADAGERGMLLLYLSDFLLLRFKSETLEDVLRRSFPATADDGRVYFKSVDFLTFLRKRSFMRYDVNELYTELRKHAQLTTTEKTILGRTLTLWSVPVPTDEQSQPFSTPKAAHAGY